MRARVEKRSVLGWNKSYPPTLVLTCTSLRMILGACKPIKIIFESLASRPATTKSLLYFEGNIKSHRLRLHWRWLLIWYGVCVILSFSWLINTVLIAVLLCFCRGPEDNSRRSCSAAESYGKNIAVVPLFERGDFVVSWDGLTRLLAFLSAMDGSAVGCIAVPLADLYPLVPRRLFWFQRMVSYSLTLSIFIQLIDPN